MNEELYIRMKVYKHYFYTAFYADYIRGVTKNQLEDLVMFGNELGVKLINKNCNVCIFNLVHKLAEIYFAYEESITNLEKVEEETKDGKEKATIKNGKQKVSNPKRNSKRSKADGSNK